MNNNTHTLIDPCKFNKLLKKLRAFCDKKGLTEVHTQNRLSILAACEDPETISTYNYGGQVWPLPQTGQMWLEYELLKNPDSKGFYCLSTSYRNEPNPKEGRHDLIFPMWEVEIPGDMNDMMQFQRELLEHLGFGEASSFPEGDYDDVAKKYGVKELEHEHEEQLKKDHGTVFFLKNFPNYTSPFWNMQQGEDGNHAKKVDVIINGQETIGSAQRSTDPDEMRKQFYTISNGGYANILFSNFTKQRVESELNEFLKFKFFPRSGFGCGVTRLLRGLEANNLL